MPKNSAYNQIKLIIYTITFHPQAPLPYNHFYLFRFIQPVWDGRFAVVSSLSHGWKGHKEDCRAKWTIDRAVLPTDNAAVDSAESAYSDYVQDMSTETFGIASRSKPLMNKGSCMEM